MKNKLIGYIFIILPVIFWGITFVCTKILLNDFSAIEILFVRFTLAYLGLWILYPKYEKIKGKDNFYFALAGLTGVILYQFFENMALSYTDPTNVSVIVSICPMFTAIFSQIIFKEKHVTSYFIIGFFIAIFGVSLVTMNGNFGLKIAPKGDLIALASSICWGLYSVVVSIINKKSYNSIAGTRRIFFFRSDFYVTSNVVWSI